MELDIEKYNLMLSGLFDKHPSVQQVGFGGGAYKPGLDGMKGFDEALGSPWKGYPCIHVAGTNGKGSVSSMLAAALSAGGMKVGLYTSPHLADFRERMKTVYGGTFRMPSREYVWDFLHGHALDGLSFFEITTGMAFSWFADEKVDAAVIETGLGGRLDSTNIITPRLSIITSIGLDHCALLGDTRAKIAVEKAGIFKKGVPALVSTRDAETSPVFEHAAGQLPCPLYYACDFDEELFETDLRGPYQQENLRTALAALDLLGIGADRGAISRAAAVTGLRGRWEKLFDSPETICDIGHNPPALRINFDRLRQSGRPLFIVYGIMADKDLGSILPLMPKEAKYFIAAPDIPRALPAEELAGRMSGFDTVCCGSVASACTEALRQARDIEDSLVYIGGSNYLVSECILNINTIRKDSEAR